MGEGGDHAGSGDQREEGDAATATLGPVGRSSTTEMALSNLQNDNWLPLSVKEDTTEREISSPSLQPSLRPPIGPGNGTNRTASGEEPSEDHTGSGLVPVAGGGDTPCHEDEDWHHAHACFPDGSVC